MRYFYAVNLVLTFACGYISEASDRIPLLGAFCIALFIIHIADRRQLLVLIRGYLTDRRAHVKHATRYPVPHDPDVQSHQG